MKCNVKDSPHEYLVQCHLVKILVLVLIEWAYRSHQICLIMETTIIIIFEHGSPTSCEHTSFWYVLEFWCSRVNNVLHLELFGWNIHDYRSMSHIQ